MNNQEEKLFPFETLEQCRTHYCEPFPKYITCSEFGELDGMNGSCHWCKEMTPIQFEMCWDESCLRDKMKYGNSKCEAVKKIEKEKNKRISPTSMFISASKTGLFDVKVFNSNDYASFDLTFEEMISSLEEIVNSCNVCDVHIDIVKLGVLYALIESIVTKKKNTVIHRIIPADLQSKVFKIVKNTVYKYTEIMHK